MSGAIVARAHSFTMNRPEPLIPGAASAFLLTTLTYAALAALAFSLVYAASTALR